jgi:cob(I)alamin adenosyltransferase
MVQLTRIYTRGGDKGKTSLGNGERRLKDDLRLHAIGDVDETNSAVGMVRLYTTGKEDAMLERIQHDLFDLGADLCFPTPQEGSLQIIATQVSRLEAEIDDMNTHLCPLNSFVLPGGKASSAFLHLARSITRRAERSMIALGREEEINQEALRYINRLSDHLFVLSRYLNEGGHGDILWKPGINR